MSMESRRYLKNKGFITVIMPILQVISRGKQMSSLNIGPVSIIHMHLETNIWINDINGMPK